MLFLSVALLMLLLLFLFAMLNCNSMDAALSASMFYLIVALWMLVFLFFLVAICVTKCFVDDGSIAGIPVNTTIIVIGPFSRALLERNILSFI